MQYLAPQSVQELVDLKARFRDDGLVLAGGQSLSVLMQNRLVQPGAIISLQNIAPLADVQIADDGTVTLGAAVTMHTVVSTPDLQAAAPILAHITSLVASPHVRALGTLVGNLCHAEAGSDPPQALLLLDAEVLVASTRGERTVPVSDFIVGHFQNNLEPDEVATAVRFKPTPTSAFHYTKYRRRQMDLAVVGVAVLLEQDDASGCLQPAIAIGGTGERPQRLSVNEGWLLTTEDLLADRNEIADAAAATANVTMADVFGSIEYRRHLVRTGIAVGIQEACARLTDER